MFSKEIFKQSIKNNWKIWLVITLTTTMFLALLIFLFEVRQDDPHGGAPTLDNVVDLLAISFYGLLGIILPMIYIIFVGNNLIASEVDKGTLSCYLNTPITRTKIISTKAIAFIGSLLLMFVIITIVGISLSSLVNTDLDIKIFLLLNIGLLLYQFAISGIVYLTSAYFNNASSAMAIGAGIPIAFFILAIIAGLDDSLEFLNNFTLNTLFNSTNIMAETNYVIQFITMFVIAITTYITSLIYFNKKDLPI